MISVNFLCRFFGVIMESLLFQDIVIQQDDEIRLKIVGTRVDKNDIVSFVYIVITNIYFLLSHHTVKKILNSM